jgi:hypothetical protein
MNASDAGGWSGNWAWSLPLIVLNVVIHVIGLALWASSTSSATDCTRIFSMTCPRCILTIFSVVPRSAAICLFS